MCGRPWHLIKNNIFDPKIFILNIYIFILTQNNIGIFQNIFLPRSGDNTGSSSSRILNKRLSDFHVTGRYLLFDNGDVQLERWETTNCFVTLIIADGRDVSVPDAEEVQVEEEEEEEDPVHSQKSQYDEGHGNRGAFSALPAWKKVKKAVGSLSCRKGKSKSSGSAAHPGQDSLGSWVHGRDPASMTHIHRRVMRKKRKNKRETDESGNSDYSPGPLPDEVRFLLRCALPS